MNLSSGARVQAWRAEAVRHRLQRRVRPAQRHDVLGPLTTQKLLLAATRRQISAGQFDAAQISAQLDRLTEMRLAAQSALAGLRLWDDLIRQQAALAEVFRQVDTMARQACAMSGHRLDTQADPELPMADVPSLHYLLLGLVLHAADSVAAGATLFCRATAEAPHRMAIRLQVRPSEATGVRPPLADGPSESLVIDADDLRVLAADASWVLELRLEPMMSWLIRPAD